MNGSPVFLEVKMKLIPSGQSNFVHNSVISNKKKFTNTDFEALAPDSLEILYLAWKMEAKRMGYFSKEEWNRANAHFRIETPQKLSDDLRTTVRGLTFLTQDAKMVRFTSKLNL